MRLLLAEWVMPTVPPVVAQGRCGMDSPQNQAGEVADGVTPHHGDPAAGTCVIYVPTEGWAKMPSVGT